jgi:hypothetical protein
MDKKQALAKLQAESPDTASVLLEFAKEFGLTEAVTISFEDDAVTFGTFRGAQDYPDWKRRVEAGFRAEKERQAEKVRKRVDRSA